MGAGSIPARQADHKSQPNLSLSFLSMEMSAGIKQKKEAIMKVREKNNKLVEETVISFKIKITLLAVVNGKIKVYQFWE